MDANIFEKANQAVKTCDTAYFGVIDENGYPSVSTVSVLRPENIFEVYFSAGMDGNKTNRLRKDNRSSVCFRAGGDNITLAGTAEILTSPAIKSRFWEGWFIDHFPLGETDPGYCVVKFTTERVSLWVGGESAKFMISELLAVQSRCGLLCRSCTFRASFHCGGCVETNGHPFHGECPVAKCCQEKGFAHCGECTDMPCGQLYEYSHLDAEHGDDPPGARIAVCQAWAGHKASVK